MAIIFKLLGCTHTQTLHLSIRPSVACLSQNLSRPIPPPQCRKKISARRQAETQNTQGKSNLNRTQKKITSERRNWKAAFRIYHAPLLVGNTCVDQENWEIFGVVGLSKGRVELPVFCDNLLALRVWQVWQRVRTLFEVLGCVVEEDDVALGAVCCLVHHLDFQACQLVWLLLEHLHTG